MKGTFWVFAALVASVAFTVVACGNDKPPMTPDSLDGPQIDVAEAGAPAVPATPAAPAMTAPAKK